ncbi:MAG: carbohydrate kinase, partial [Maritimibacter sp.]
QGRKARWRGGEPPLGSGRRAAALALYLALVTDHCLGLIGHRGPVIAAGSATGTSQGAALLAGSAQPPALSEADAIHRETDARLIAYARAWRKALA